ncbi:MAG: chitobiase/beta-hexosaminidase C-terminal domain-containing protein [Myxococcales bacterium]|nr:chitobiase/beta-hexosaminidase C-terminal domain-containing protein [Myxococcales bacterium]
MPRLAPCLLALVAFACGASGAGEPGSAADAGPRDGATAAGDVRAPVTTATPAGGAHPGPLSVTLTTDEPATVRYTTDGSDPSPSSAVYVSPIPIQASTVLRFYAEDPAGNSELAQQEAYTLPSQLRYAEVQQKSVHNAYERDEPLFDQLVYHRVRSVELDVHNGQGGKPDVPGDFYVYHEDLPLFRDTSCDRLSQCLGVLAGFHRAVPDHEVVTLLVDLKDAFVAGHSRADLEAQLDKALGPALFRPAALFGSCAGAQSVREAVTGGCKWPTLDALRGRFVVLFTGGTGCDPASAASAYVAPPGAARDRAGFSAPNVTPSCPFTAYDDKKDFAFFNLDEPNLPAAKAIRQAGLVSRAYKGGLGGGFDDEASYAAARAAGVHLVATNQVNYLVAPWTITHQKTGWPFSCFGACPGSPAEKDSIFGVVVDSGDVWDKSDSGYFRHDGPRPGPATITAFVSTASSHAEPWGKACLAARASLADGAAYYAVCRPQDAHAVRVQARASAGASTDAVEAAAAPGLSPESGFFLRLILAPSGASTTVTGEVSSDGVTYRRVDSRVIAGALDYRGILASSHGAGRARFSFGGVTVATPAGTTPVGPTTWKTGTLLGGAKSGSIALGVVP